MGHNDHNEDNRPELPPEAGKSTPTGFQPNDEWLKTAEPALCHEAMRTWFVTRYRDPANDTPYNSEEGGYLYIHGGPYDAAEQLYGRFGDLFIDKAVRAVVDDVESDGILEWAPIHTEPDYDRDFEFEANERGDPYQFFERRLNDLDALVAAEVDGQRQPLLRQLLYSSLITALEAYLADTTSYWLSVDTTAFRKFVSTFDEFKHQKLTVSQIFDRLDTLEEDVERHLHQLVWHRLDKVVPLMADSLGIARPAIGELMRHILVRHDIVHRGGRTKDGDGVTVTSEDWNELRGAVVAFVDEIEIELRKRFPLDVSSLVGSEF